MKPEWGVDGKTKQRGRPVPAVPGASRVLRVGRICDSVQGAKSLGTPRASVAHVEVLRAGLETGVPGETPITLS